MQRILKLLSSNNESLQTNGVFLQIKKFLTEHACLDAKARAEILKLNILNPDPILKEEIADFVTLSSPEEAKNMEEVVTKLNLRKSANLIELEQILAKHAQQSKASVLQQTAIETLAKMASRGSIFALQYLREIFINKDEIYFGLSLLQALDCETSLNSRAAIDIGKAYSESLKHSKANFYNTLRETLVYSKKSMLGAGIESTRWLFIGNSGTAAADTTNSLIEKAKSLVAEKKHYVAAQHYLKAAFIASVIPSKLMFFDSAYEQSLQVQSDCRLRIIAEIVFELKKLNEATQRNLAQKQKNKKFVTPEEFQEQEKIEKALTQYKTYLDCAKSPFKQKILEIEINAGVQKRTLAKQANTVTVPYQNHVSDVKQESDTRSNNPAFRAF